MKRWIIWIYDDWARGRRYLYTSGRAVCVETKGYREEFLLDDGDKLPILLVKNERC